MFFGLQYLEDFISGINREINGRKKPSQTFTQKVCVSYYSIRVTPKLHIGHFKAHSVADTCAD